MHNSCWARYHIQSALIINLHSQAKILCAWLLKDKGKYWNYSGQWWAPGAHKDDYWQRLQQG